MLKIMAEESTLEACKRTSIARYGDGELRCAIGDGCTSQRGDPRLRVELADILGRDRGMLVGIPNFHRGPRVRSWAKYAGPGFRHLYRLPEYASAFITRPDNAPWIDTPEYWRAVRSLWAGRDVTLVVGDEKSITPEMLENNNTGLLGAGAVRVVWGPRQHAYAEIDRIEAEIGTPSGLVILCLGACATALAARLHDKGVHALDLGHMGMFMKHAGAYAFQPNDLTSAGYRDQLQRKHAGMKWGKSGHSHAPEVVAFARTLEAASVLDYGCGRATLKGALEQTAPGVRVFEYDPGIPGKDILPKPADLVVSTDVLEHIETDKVDAVLRHIRLLAKRGAYLVIAMRPARELLPDGRNAHLTVADAPWWLSKLKAAGWVKMRHEVRKGLCVWLET